MEENHEYTCGEFEEMDLTELHDKAFMVAMNSGPRGENQYMCSTLCGPLDFYEMCEMVGQIYEQEMIHAKVMITHKDFGTEPTILDENTVDFIEARYQDIVMDGMLGGELFEEKEFTCKAGFNLSNTEMAIKKAEEQAEQEDDSEVDSNSDDDV